MSHYKEREEKVCLNCGAELIGHFCQKCGQENREPKSTVWGLVSHFFYDVTHFDGKFFHTTGYLISRPGLLPKEYIRGRRASYLDPIRMYIFSSAIFFLIFFSVYHVGNISGNNLPGRRQTVEAMDKAKAELLKNSTTHEDSVLIEQQFSRATLKLTKDSTTTKNDSTRSKDSTTKVRPARNNWNFNLSEVPYTKKEEYDSVQHGLPPGERDGWFKRRTVIRAIDLKSRIEKDENQFWQDVLSKFIHNFPYLLFVSLPLYTLFLKLLYVRRKKFYYVDHALFLIFLYIFTFIFLLAFIGVDELSHAVNWGWLDWVELLLIFWGIYYAWRAMHKFYEQGKFKTTLKFILFNLMCLVSLVILFCLFFLLTIFSI